MKTKNIVKGFGDKFSVKSVGKILFFWMVIFGVIISMSSIVMAEYIDQPVLEVSTINAFDGNHIYDFELAYLIEKYIGDNCSDMIFIFGTCYGGGMIDDLVELNKKCKLIACSASRHNETSLGGSNFGNWAKPEDYYKKAWKDAAENPAKTVNQICHEAEQNDVRGPNGNPVKEHPQKKLDGAGAANIKIGNRSTATSYHAILFVGVDAPRHKNDLKRMYDNLKAKYGFTDDNIHVLALNGPGSVPGVTVDGNGTSDALENELKKIQPKMNESEQFLFWADGHGNWEKLNSTVTEVPHSTNTTYTITIDYVNMIDEWYEGHVGIFAEGVTAGDGTEVYFNGNLLGSLSNKTNKTIFPFDKRLLKSKNEIIIKNICNPETICITKVTTGGSSSGDEAPEVKVEVNAPEIVKAGEFEASIDVDSIVDFNSGQFDLSFDSSVVKVMGVAGGSIDGAPIPVSIWESVDANTVRVLISMPIGEGVSGSGYLAKVSFEVVGKAGDKSVLGISNGMLVNKEAEAIPTEWIDDEVIIFPKQVNLTAKQPRNVVAEDDDYTIEGTATGVDDVDIVLINPGGTEAWAWADYSVLNGLAITSTPVTDNEFSEDITMTEGLDLGRWKTMVFSPGIDAEYGDLYLGAGELDRIPTAWFAGKTQDQIVAILENHTVNATGSDDLCESFTFKVEYPYVKLNPIESVAVGEPLYVSGTTNREPEIRILIWTVAGPAELPPVMAEVEWPTLDGGVFNATIDTTDAVPATYTLEADDGDGHTDTAIVEIW